MAIHKPGLSLFAVFLAVTAARADDWPQWRGPNRDGVWRETGILTAIPSSGVKFRWRARIGTGYSGPVVAQGRVFVTDHKFNPEVERVVCFDEAMGKPLWTHAYPCDYQDMEYGNGPRAAPTVHEGKVYTLGTKGHLYCLDAATGQVLWKKELAKDFNGVIPRYGASAAPLVEGDLLIVSAGSPDGTVMALDRHTGKERWRALKERPAYSTPIIISAGGCRQLVFWTADTVASLAPATGKIYWQVPFKATFDEAQMVASPVLHKDRLLCLAAWSRGSLMLKLDSTKPAASLVWRTKRRPTTTITTPVFQDDRDFYAIESDGSLCCLDAGSADVRWSTREATSERMGSAHLTPNGERVFLFNQSGHLILARLTPKRYQELGRCLLVEPTAGYRPQGNVAWAHPAYANKCVFARNDRELVCASLAANSVANIPQTVQTLKARPLPGSEKWHAVAAMAYSPDGKTLAAGSWMATVKLLDLTTGKELPAPARHKDSVCAVAFSPDGKLLASAGGNEFKPARNGYKTTGQVKLWDLAARTERELAGHTNKVLAAVFAPNSKTLATGSADQTLRLWDVATGKERAVLKGHAEAIWSVAYSADGKIVASASFDRTVRLWDANTGKEAGILKGHDEEVMAVAIAPDGQTLATGSADWTIRLWNLPTKTARAVLNGHGGTVYCLRFLADGRTLASGSGDETVKLWDVATAKERLTLRGHRSGVHALAVSSSGLALASAGMDDAVRIWELSDRR